MRSLTTTIGRIAMAALMATLGVALFAPAAFASHEQRTGVSMTSASPCVSPPAGFNPLTATDTELLYYGLPVRPSTSSSTFDQWTMAVTYAKRRGCDEHAGNATHVSHHEHPTTGQLGLVIGGNWSGWEAIKQTYYAASGQWKVPCINTGNSPSNSDNGDWVGLGGEGNGNLLQAGTYWDYSSRSWWSFYEEVGSGAYTTKPDEFANVSCGDSMFTEIDYGQSYVSQSYYFVEDVTHGAYWSNHNYFAPEFNSAEWIDESSICDSNHDWRMRADFGTIYWSYTAAGLSYSTEHSTSYWPNTQWYSTANLFDNTVTARASGLGSGGNNFTDTWATHGANYC